MSQELFTSFGAIEEPRQAGKVDHLLIDVLAIRPSWPEAAYLGIYKNNRGTNHSPELCRYITTFSVFLTGKQLQLPASTTIVKARQ
jgi:hypothetical protein